MSTVSMKASRPRKQFSSSACGEPHLIFQRTLENDRGMLWYVMIGKVGKCGECYHLSSNLMSNNQNISHSMAVDCDIVIFRHTQTIPDQLRSPKALVNRREVHWFIMFPLKIANCLGAANFRHQNQPHSKQNQFQMLFLASPARWFDAATWLRSEFCGRCGTAEWPGRWSPKISEPERTIYRIYRVNYPLIDSHGYGKSPSLTGESRN